MFQINSLVPELFCSDFHKSLQFYTETLGFGIGQQRRGEAHCYIELERNQFMLVQEDDEWLTASLEPPYGRGVNFQCFVSDVERIHEAVRAAGYETFVDLHTHWYWRSDVMEERTQFGVLDPDGYFLRFAQVKRNREVTEDDHRRLDAEWD